MEQELINALLKLLAKAGGGSIVRELIRETDENGNPKVWNLSELEKALWHVNEQTAHFGKEEASAVIKALLKKYDLHGESFLPADTSVPDSPGVQGLQ